MHALFAFNLLVKKKKFTAILHVKKKFSVFLKLI